MKNLFRAIDADRTTIFEGDTGLTVAIFINTDDGKAAYGHFVAGLIQGRNFNLYDETGEFLAGALSV